MFDVIHGYYNKMVFSRPLYHATMNIEMGTLRATSHTRLRVHDLYTPNTLIGGKGGAGPSSLHTTLEGPTKHVSAKWM